MFQQQFAMARSLTQCLLSERLRTTIYRVPQFFAAAGEGFSGVVFDADDFRAGVTTNPEEYFLQNDPAGQFVDDPTYRPWVRESCNTEPGTSVTNLQRRASGETMN